jgi:hypothetical protein
MAKNPEVRRIGDRIADDHWSYSTPDGHGKTSRVVIGRPMPWPDDPQGDWICPVEIEGFTHGIATLAGVGPVDALMNAMRVVQAFADQIGTFTPRVREKSKSIRRARRNSRPQKALGSTRSKAKK